MPRALDGLEVLELCSMVAGPNATKLLAEFGAGVVKIEPPAAGDPARQRTGSWPQELNQPSSLFLYLDSDKRSITLSLTSAGGRRIFRRLVQDADVLVQD